ncbi:hypothetical protein [Algibacter aquimarinus]
MESFPRISKRLDIITNENLNNCRRILNFHNTDTTIWKGCKRYAH